MPPPPSANSKSKGNEKVALIVIPKELLDACATNEDKKQFLGNYLYQYVLKRI